MKIEYYPLLDSWVSNLGIKAASEILKVLNILRTESNKYDESVFLTPFRAFQEANLDPNTYESILFNLDKNKIIEAVSSKPIVVPEDSNAPSGSVDSIADNIRIIEPRFRYVFSLLKIKLGNDSEVSKKITPELLIKLQNLKHNLPPGRKYKMARKFLDRIIQKDGQIPAYILAQAIKPTYPPVRSNNYKFRKLGKGDYIRDKDELDAKVRNHLKTLNPLLEQIGCKLGLKHNYWVLISINN